MSPKKYNKSKNIFNLPYKLYENFDFELTKIDLLCAYLETSRNN